MTKEELVKAGLLVEYIRILYAMQDTEPDKVIINFKETGKIVYLSEFYKEKDGDE